MLAAVATLSLGLVLGPEAPLIAIGLGLPPLVVHLMRLQQEEGRLLSLAGAFAAIAALFGGPIVAALMLFELTTKSGAVAARAIGSALLPGFVAAGTGALIFTGVGDWSGLHQQNLALPDLPAYDTVRIADLGWCIVLSVAVALVILVVRRFAWGVAGRAPLGRSPRSSSPDCSWASWRSSSARSRTGRSTSSCSRARANCPSWSPRVLRACCSSVVLIEGARLLAIARGGLPRRPGLPGDRDRHGPRGGGGRPPARVRIHTGDHGRHRRRDCLVLQAPFSAALLASLLVGSSATDVAPIAVIAGAVGALAAVALPDPRPGDGAATPEDAAAATH